MSKTSKCDFVEQKVSLKKEIVDIEATKQKIVKIEEELVAVKAKMSEYLQELGL